MKKQDKYEIEVFPDGLWTVDLIRDEQLRPIARGKYNGRGKYYGDINIMGHAEDEARNAVNAHKAKRLEQDERAKGTRRITIPY